MKTILMITGILLVVSSCECFKVKDDIRVVWSLRFRECRCQNYSFRNAEPLDDLIPCEKFYAPIRANNISKCQDDDFSKKNPRKCFILPNDEYCDDLVGFIKESWAENITPHARETIACIEDENKNSKCNN